MGIKETPVNYRVYYSSMKNNIAQKRKEAKSILQDLYELENNLYIKVKSNINEIKITFGINILNYPEFINNRYDTGKFLKIAKSLFINKKEYYKLVSDLFDLYNLAKKQKEIFDLEKEIDLYNRLLNLSIKDYNNILKTFYTEVHKKLIDGCAYRFEDNIGWTCINRCHIIKQRPRIDYAATKKNKLKLLAEGKRLYNKEEAKWCEENGIDYNGVDGRVYLNNEYCYEIPLIDCKLPNGSDYKLTITDYRGTEVRGKTNEDLLEKCNGDLNKICELPIDLKSKLTLCLKADKMLYLKFIRNENQKPINTPKASR